MLGAFSISSRTSQVLLVAVVLVTTLTLISSPQLGSLPEAPVVSAGEVLSNPGNYLEVGDVLLTPGRSKIIGVFSYLSGLHFQHVAFVYGNSTGLYTLEATTPRVKINRLDDPEAGHLTVRVAKGPILVLRLKPQYRWAIPKAISYALEQVGKPYSYVPPDWILTKVSPDDFYYCTELVYDSLKHALGRDPTPSYLGDPFFVPPEAFIQSPYLEPVLYITEGGEEPRFLSMSWFSLIIVVGYVALLVYWGIQPYIEWRRKDFLAVHTAVFLFGGRPALLVLSASPLLTLHTSTYAVVPPYLWVLGVVVPVLGVLPVVLYSLYLRTGSGTLKKASWVLPLLVLPIFPVYSLTTVFLLHTVLEKPRTV